MNHDGMKKYKLISKKGEGTFSEVVKVQNIETGVFFAMKCMKGSFTSSNQVYSLREIQALRRLSPHPNIICLVEIIFDQSTGRLAMVFELMDANLYDIIKCRKIGLNECVVRNIIFQILISLTYMHKMGIFHRDIKPENILIDQGLTTVKLADFGSCRGIHNKPPFTEYIATRWYRAPECLITDGFYGEGMDVWGAGCVLFELIALFPIFPGVNEIDQINRIHRILGSPSEEILMKFLKNGSRYSHVTFQKQGASGFTHLLPGTSELCLDLLTKMLAYDVSDRIASGEALKHPYFKEFEDRIINHDPLSVSDEHVRPDANYSSTITVPDKPSMHMEKKTLNPTICTVDSLQNDSKVGKMTACFVDSTKRQPVLTQQRHSKFFNQASNIKRPKPVTNINHNQIRLPSIENSKRVITRVTERNKVEMNKLQYKIEKPIRNKLYASVVSSGYGSSYIPASLSHKNQGQSSSQLLGRKGNVHLSSIR